MKKILLPPLLLLLCGSAWAEMVNYAIDPEVTKPRFDIPHVGFTSMSGRFNAAEGAITLDLAAQSGKVEFKVAATSIDIGNGGWEAHLRDPGLLNVIRFPTIRYVSSQLVFKDGKVVAADGEFTLLGVTKPLRVSVENFHCGVNPINQHAVCGGEIRARIKRSDFGMIRYIPEVSDEVDITVPVEARRLP